MPLDGTPATHACEAAEVLQILAEKFRSGEWRWIQGRALDGSGGYCLMGAALKARFYHPSVPPSDLIERYLVQAINKSLGFTRRNLATTNRCRVTYFNDHQSFEAVMDVISIAMHMADAEAGKFDDAV